MPNCSTSSLRLLVCALLSLVALSLPATSARAEALLLVDAENGKVLYAENATYPWHPASVTKLMTAYVTLRAVKDQRISLDKVLTVSPVAMAQQPSKMGFKVGVQVTVDNALKMMMVKSANDMAVVLAEGVSGSVESFAAEMNRTAQRLGMSQSNFVNPNGLPADEQVTSARDLAILARALINDFPEYELYWHIPAIKLGRRILRNHNPLIDRYPGADGMKTGFICASGFNLVATVTRGNRRLIAVVLGAPNSAVRTQEVVRMFDQGFSANPLSWLLPSSTVESLKPVDAPPIDLHEEICGKHRHRQAEVGEEEPPASDSDRSSAYSMITQDARSRSAKGASILGPLIPSMPPVTVFVGPPRNPGNPEAAFAKPEPKPAAQKRKPKAAPAAETTPASAPAPEPAKPKRKPSTTSSGGAGAPAVAPASSSASASSPQRP